MRHVSKILLGTTISVLLLACSAGDNKTTTANESVATASEYIFNPSAEDIESYMRFLADDGLQGREAGTQGYDDAAAYVAKTFAELGLTPAGDNGTYFQEVRLKRAYRDTQGASLTAQKTNGDIIPLSINEDFAIGASVTQPESTISAPVVFAGYGIVAPKEGRNDYEGLDVKGKIVATLARTPKGIEPEERAFYGSRKLKEASDRGAIGLVSLETITAEKVFSFGRLIKEGRLDSARMSWVLPNGEAYSRAPGLKGGAGFSRQGADHLFKDAPMSWDEISELAEKDGGVTPTFELPIEMTITQASKLDEVRSSNVAAMIEGTDPELKDEVIILTAHLDHIGVASTGEEDVINNGALDNAAGIATLLDAARMMLENEPPRRSVMFLAVTAEEKGLLGSQYFAKNPTVNKDNIVANINLDMPVLTYDFTDIIVFGGARSTIEAAISSAASDMDIVIGPDPFPEQGIFTRSDHFRFVEEGIPSVMLSTGFANGGEAAWTTHFAEHYHRPSDDLQNNINYAAAAKFAELKTRISFALANQDERPVWKKGDFFAKQFDGPTAE